MIFLIEYDRPTGNRVTFREFAGSDHQAARDAQLEIELDLNRRGVEHEVVLLEAENESAIRRTHRRYFEDLHMLLETTTKSLPI
jgi:hypothetical protein